MIKTVIINKTSITSDEIKALEKQYWGYLIRTEIRPGQLVLKFYVEA